jgi:hypothetical protein
MISQKELFLRAYKKQNNLNPDITLPSSSLRKIVPIKKIKSYSPRNINVATRYGDMKIANKEI